MTRSLTTAVKNHLATNEIKPVHLITIGFGTPQNLTDCVHDLTSSVSGSSVTYSSSSFLVSYPEVSEQTDIGKSSISIALSGADPIAHRSRQASCMRSWTGRPTSSAR